MNMTPEQLHDITPRELYNKIDGFDLVLREEYERARIHAFICISPYIGKNQDLSILKLWPLPWDKELKGKQQADLKERQARAREIWAKVDAGKAKEKQKTLK